MNVRMIHAAAVTFTPTTDALTNGSVELTCGEAGCNQRLSFSGQGVNRALECNPVLLAFGDVNPGECATLTTTCRNTVNGTIELEAVETGDARLTVSPEGAVSLGPESQRELRFTFCPAVVGDASWAVTIRGAHSSLGPESEVIQLEGAGGGGDVRVKSTIVDFGEVALVAPAHRRIQISNQGWGMLSIFEARIDSVDADAFSVSASGATIEPGSTHSITVEFAPHRTGPLVASLVLVTDDPDSPLVSVALAGRGVALKPCTFRLQPPVIDFHTVERGEVATAHLDIENLGDSDCLISGLELLAASDPAFSLPDAPAARILPGGTEVVSVRFAPTVQGDHAGTIELGLSNPLMPWTQIALYGTASDGSLLVAPQVLDFGLQAPECPTSTRSVNIYNRSAQPIALSAMQASDNRLTHGPLPELLAPFESASIRVGFTGGRPGRQTAQLVLATTAGDALIAVHSDNGPLGPRVDTFTQMSPREVDVLFILDHSPCSSLERTTLSTEIGAYLAQARSHAVDYQLGVITSDTDSEGGRLLHPEYPDPFGGPLSDRIITELSEPTAEVAFAAHAHARPEDGAAGPDESPLEAARLALSAPLSFGYNAGFLRPNANLALVMMQDEEDQSPGSVSFYLDAFRRLKNDPRQVSVSTIMGDPQNACPGAIFDESLAAIAEKSGGGVMSLCASNWGDELSRLSLSAFGQLSRFALSERPNPESARVFVDGVELPLNPGIGGWWIEGDELWFLPAAVPEPGAQIRVEYVGAVPVKAVLH